MPDLVDLLAQLTSEAIAMQDPATQARLRAALKAGAEVLVQRSPGGILTVRIDGTDVIRADLATLKEMREPWAN